MSPEIETARAKQAELEADYLAQDAILKAAEELQAKLTAKLASAQERFDADPTDENADLLLAVKSEVERGELFVARESKLHNEAFVASEKAEAETEQLIRYHFDALLSQPSVEKMLEAPVGQFVRAISLIAAAQQGIKDVETTLVTIANEKAAALQTGHVHSRHFQAVPDLNLWIRTLVARGLPEGIKLPLIRDAMRELVPHEQVVDAIREGKF